MSDLLDLVGERLMIGLPGPTLRDEDVALFRDTRAAGLILYRRNFENPDRLLTLLGDLENALGRRLLVATDHEGGRIVMLGQGTTIFPDNLAVGTAGDEAFAARQGLFEARELRRLGVDLNLGPVLDVLTEAYSPNIGIRSYGMDPDLVARYGVARIRGMQRGGLAACPKHFLPATFSRVIVEDYLRGRLGFRGVVVSDDLEMGAITESCPIGEAAVRAAAAGHDLLLVCHTEVAQRRAAGALVEAYRGGTLARGELESAAERVRRLRETRQARFEGGAPRPEPDGEPLAMAIATRAVTIVRPGPPGLSRALNGRVAVIFPRFSALASRITIEAKLCDEEGYVTRAFGVTGISPAISLVAIEPSPAEIEAAAAAAAGGDVTVLFLFDGHLYPSNRALLDAVQGRARKLAVVLLRDPYDASLLAPGVLGITAYGFRRAQLDAVIARLTHPTSRPRGD